MPQPTSILPVRASLLGSIARTASATGGPVSNSNPYYSGVWLFVNVTAINTAGVYSLNFQAQDPVSTNYVTIAAPTTNITATGTFAYYVGPHGVAPAGGTLPSVAEMIGLQMPDNWQVLMTLVSGTGQTFSVGYVLLP